ncbi:serine acetyltransferase [Mucilaginibacter sp.]|uniref:serine O-acetyltransferase n=1 Tax=Mucilaginibacter sp. TaxID=1882438 RepID=UPI002ED38B2A
METQDNRKQIFQDWKSNKGYFKAQFILVLFRIAHLIITSHVMIKILFCWYLLFYQFFVEWVLGVELSWNLVIGKGVKLYHGQSLIVNGFSVIGENCVLRHSTTIGNKSDSVEDAYACPRIGNNVDIGSNVCIIGNISIGDNVSIGAGSIVVKDVPSNCVVVGNPARIIKFLK